MQLAFSHLNLCFNPFGELGAEQRQQLAVVNLLSFEKTLRIKSTAIQFYADHGRGKTTHLLALHKMYSDAQYIKLYAGSQCDIRPRKILFVDSIENISKRQRLRLYKNTDSIAITSHVDLSRELASAGFRVFNNKVSATDNNILLEIFNRRIAYARRNAGDIPVLDMQIIDQLKQLYGDDVRKMEADLYERFQIMQGVESVKM